jgi:DNA-binding XRE family transcriptional regulator
MVRVAPQSHAVARMAIPCYARPRPGYPDLAAHSRADVDKPSISDIILSVNDEISENDTLITPIQMKAARALLGWRQADLATASGVAEITIRIIERGATDARGSTLGKIQSAFEAAGLEIIPGGGASLDGGPGVRIKRR